MNCHKQTYTILIILTLLDCPLSMAAQSNDAFSQLRQSINKGTTTFNQSRSGNFNDYRQNLNAQYERITPREMAGL